jgi:ribosomal protein L11 methyltransferase
MLALFPEGFEEAERGEALELRAYTDESGERRAREGFGSVQTTAIPDDWEQRWREFHRAIEVGGLWVGPPWTDPPPGTTAVTIEPGRAFGTGAHPTTRLCVELVSELSPGSLLDAGCGSGVIAIAASLLGFAPVIAVDIDAAAVEAAARNAAANGVELDVRRADVAVDSLPATDIVVANIDARLVGLVGERVAAPHLVTSGYFESHAPGPTGYRRVERRTENGWAADLHARE